MPITINVEDEESLKWLCDKLRSPSDPRHFPYDPLRDVWFQTLARVITQQFQDQKRLKEAERADAPFELH